MKFIFQPHHLRWLWRAETIALIATIAIAQVFKLPLTTTAEVPRVVSGDQQQVKATASARAGHRQEQERQVRPENYDLARYPITNDQEEHWRNILWTTAVVQPQEAFVAAALDQILALMLRPGLSDSQMRTIDTAAKVGTQLFTSNPNLYSKVGIRFADAIANSPDPEWVAVALSGLVKVGIAPAQQQQWMDLVKRRFPNWANNLYLRTTLRDMAEALVPQPTPPLADLLNWQVAPNQLHLYVLCQPDRYVLCQTVLKDAAGRFVREPNGQLWGMPLLLRSIHNLSWNFVRGQTPQGIYRIESVVPQPDDEYFRAYGQFALVNLYLPFESGAKAFVPGQPGAFTGSVEAYQNLLPPSWRSRWAMQQAYWAGKIGRSEFRIHGTGDAPDFFSNKEKNPDSFNWNPSIGCLSALELYNEKGQLLEADMPKLLGKLESAGGQSFSGYLIVAEFPSPLPGQPLSLTQIEAAIAPKR